MSEEEKKDLPKAPAAPAKKVTIVGMPLVELSPPEAEGGPAGRPPAPAAPPAAPAAPKAPPKPPMAATPPRPPAPPAPPAPKAPPPARKPTMIGVAAAPKPAAPPKPAVPPAAPPAPPAPTAEARPPAPPRPSLTEVTQPFDLEEKQPIAPPSPGRLSMPEVEEPGLRKIGERDTPVVEAPAELAYLDVELEQPSIDVSLDEDPEIDEALGALDVAIDPPAEDSATASESELQPDPGLAASAAPSQASVKPPAVSAPEPGLAQAPEPPAEAPPAAAEALAEDPSAAAPLAHAARELESAPSADFAAQPNALDANALEEESSGRLSSPIMKSAGRAFLVKVFIGGATLLGIVAVALIVLFRGARDDRDDEILAEPETPAVAITAEQNDQGQETNAQARSAATRAEPEVAAETKPQAESQAEEQAAKAHAESTDEAAPEAAEAATPSEATAERPSGSLTSSASASVIIAPPTEVEERYEALSTRRRRARGRELVNAGNFLRNRDQHDEAIERYVDALSYDPGLAAAISGGLQSWLAKDEPATALAWAERLVEVLPASAGSYTLKARALLGLNRVDEAATAVEAARELDPRSRSVAELDEEIAAR